MRRYNDDPLGERQSDTDFLVYSARCTRRAAKPLHSCSCSCSVTHDNKPDAPVLIDLAEHANYAIFRCAALFTSRATSLFDNKPPAGDAYNCKVQQSASVHEKIAGCWLAQVG